jgi:hypothetical protein
MQFNSLGQQLLIPCISTPTCMSQAEGVQAEAAAGANQLQQRCSTEGKTPAVHTTTALPAAAVVSQHCSISP